MPPVIKPRSSGAIVSRASGPESVGTPCDHPPKLASGVKRAEARGLLAPIYNWFMEGFNGEPRCIAFGGLQSMIPLRMRFSPWSAQMRLQLLSLQREKLTGGAIKCAKCSTAI